MSYENGVRSARTDTFRNENGEWTSKDIFGGRDTSQYDDGGHIDCGMSPSKEKEGGVCDKKKARDFVYEHWNKKKRGYIRISYQGIDASGTDHIFVEPNETGEWRVTWRVARAHAMEEYDDRVDDYPDSISVEKVYLKDGKDWFLSLKNAEGSYRSLNPN